MAHVFFDLFLHRPFSAASCMCLILLLKNNIHKYKEYDGICKTNVISIQYFSSASITIMMELFHKWVWSWCMCKLFVWNHEYEQVLFCLRFFWEHVSKLLVFTNPVSKVDNHGSRKNAVANEDAQDPEVNSKWVQCLLHLKARNLICIYRIKRHVGSLSEQSVAKTVWKATSEHLEAEKTCVKGKGKKKEKETHPRSTPVCRHFVHSTLPTITKVSFALPAPFFKPLRQFKAILSPPKPKRSRISTKLTRNLPETIKTVLIQDDVT